MLLCILLCGAAPAFAQSYEDSVVIEENDPDLSITDTTVAAVDENETARFLSKWEYDSLSVQQRHLSDSVLKKMQQDDDFWYANTIFEKEKKQQAERNNKPGYTPLGERTWFQTLLWLIIIGGFAAFLIIYLSSSSIGLFRRKNSKTKNESEEEITEDIFAINYQKEIDKASSQGNFRLAIRLMYLRLLKNLSEKNIIQYKQDKTNMDYLMQLHSTRHYHNFFKVTRDYEYSWYGKFDVNETAYKFIRNEFDQFDNELH